MAILELKGLTKTFGGVVAVGGVDLSVEQGRIYSVIGPNGAGKTTLFNMISGFYLCDRGQVIFKGRDVTGFKPEQTVKLGMGRSFQVTKIFPKLTVFENVQAAVLFNQGQGLNLFSDSTNMAHEETRAVLAQVNLLHKADELAGVLSAGDMKRLELGIVLGTRPEMILLDEPTCGMSATETTGTIDLIRKINRDTGTTVLFTEHKMDMVFSVSAHITVMNFGVVIASGSPEEVHNDKRVREIYLGEG
ncbi:MAG: ABC transporter ATP-binding protein [Desulfomonile tiedjei]|nr:ABC transporter ATP-binding protein [Desulfomonile tiedjei]